MHTNHPKEDPLAELGYEHRDVNYKNIRNAIVIFFGFTAVCFVIGYWVYDQMHPSSYRHTIESAAKETRYKPASPNPILQDNVNAKSDIMTMRQAEYAHLHSTGPIEGSEGKVHIPVERAMELLVERGLPKTAEVAVEPRSRARRVETPETPTTPETHAADSTHTEH